MSEPMTVVEIEDVLSSIRRLVSEDLRPTHKLVSAALKNGTNKLILTPALRVVSTTVARPVATSDRGGDGGGDSVQPLMLRDAQIADPVEKAAIVPVFGSVRHVDASEAVFQDGTDAEAARPDGDFLATAMSRINGLSAVDETPMAEGIEAVVAVVGAAVGPLEWEIDGGEPAPQAEAWRDVVWNTPTLPDMAIEPASEPAAQSYVADAVLADPLMIGDVQNGDVQNGEVQNGEVQVEAPMIALDAQPVQSVEIARTAPEAGTVDGSGEAALQDGFVFPDEGALLDDTAGFLSEDMLRDIVRDMIRDELQGTLGERITRNVRKLVRAEINRALATGEFQ